MARASSAASPFVGNARVVAIDRLPDGEGERRRGAAEYALEHDHSGTAAVLFVVFLVCGVAAPLIFWSKRS